MTTKKINAIDTELSRERAVKSKALKANSKDELMDFDQFVARTPRKESSKMWIFFLLIILIVVAVGSALFFSKDKLVKEISYKAVFLDTNQVYFAKVVKEDALNIYLDDVYYIQTEQQVTPATVEGEEDKITEVPVLVKRGQELHQPDGWMQINRDKIISIEEIGAESEILKEINRQKSLPAVTE